MKVLVLGTGKVTVSRAVLFKIIDLNRVNHWPGLTTCVHQFRSIDLELIIFEKTDVSA